MKTIETLKDQLGKKFRGASLDDIQGIENFLLFSEAASNLLSAADPMETVRLHRFNQFDGIYDYEAPDDLKAKKVIDPRPQDSRQGEDFTQTYTKEFDRDKQWRTGKVSVEFQDGIKVFRLSEAGKSSQNVDVTDDDDGWSAAGGATSVAVDTTIELDGLDTLKVVLGATGGYIENSTIEEVDLSELTAGSFFRKIYIPSGASTLTSITLRIGSSSGAYYTITGEPQIGEYRNGVNIVRFDWEDGVETGSVDEAAIDYERLTFVTTAAMQPRVGRLSVKLPTPYETPYYSNRIFRNTDEEWLEAPTDDSDEIMLEKEAENIFFYECCVLVAEELGQDGEALKFKKKLNGDPERDGDDGGLYGQYQKSKPAESLPVQTRYINFRSRRDARGLRR